MNIAADHIRIG